MKKHNSSWSQNPYKNTITCIRVINYTERTLTDEKYNPSAQMVLKPFSFQKDAAMLDRCVRSGEPVYQVTSDSGIPLMQLYIPEVRDGKAYVLAYISVLQGNLYLEEYPYLEVNPQTMEKMKQLAVTDELTGLYNRRYINDTLPLDIASCSERNLPLSLLFVDVDFFKHANDRYGHVAGDFVLREIAAEFKRHIREDWDWIARFGGDEFVICLNGVSNRKAKEVAERIRKAVENCAFIHMGEEIRLTCSFGVYTFEETDAALSVDSLIQLVDRKLHEAKKQGKNMVV